MTREEARAALSDNGPDGWGDSGGRWLDLQWLTAVVTHGEPTKRQVKTFDRLNDERDAVLDALSPRSRLD